MFRSGQDDSLISSGDKHENTDTTDSFTSDDSDHEDSIICASARCLKQEKDYEADPITSKVHLLSDTLCSSDCFP